MILIYKYILLKLFSMMASDNLPLFLLICMKYVWFWPAIRGTFWDLFVIFIIRHIASPTVGFNNISEISRDGTSGVNVRIEWRNGIISSHLDTKQYFEFYNFNWLRNINVTRNNNLITISSNKQQSYAVTQDPSKR